MSLVSRILAATFAACLGVSSPATAAVVSSQSGIVERAEAPVIPRGVILIKGAVPAASDETTPLPEEGSVVDGRYRNPYFGLSVPIPSGWSEQAAGPPPSDGGSYVLSQFALHDNSENRVTANVLVSAQDLFFSAIPLDGAADLIKSMRERLDSDYEIEREPDEVKVNGRTFSRFGYMSPVARLHWRILSTEVRCHAVVLTFTGTDMAALDAAERAMSAITAPSMSDSDAAAPLCVRGYASAENIVEKVEPRLNDRHFNTIPVRIVVDTEGRVKHVHVLSAFSEQAEAIIAALRQWKFKSYVRDGKAVEVETGLVFGVPRNS